MFNKWDIANSYVIRMGNSSIYIYSPDLSLDLNKTFCLVIEKSMKFFYEVINNLVELS